jgi:hypothetical protein
MITKEVALGPRGSYPHREQAITVTEGHSVWRLNRSVGGSLRMLAGRSC